MKRISVTFYHRLPRTVGNYSLEAIFEDVRARLKEEVEAIVRHAPCHSNGVIPRLRIMFDAWRSRAEAMHITGDIHFAAIFRRPHNTILTVLDCGDVPGRRDWRGRLLRLFWFYLPARRAAHITTISEASKRDIIALTGIRPDNVSVIGVAISESFTRCDKPFNRRCPQVLQVGTSVNKNIERLAAALFGARCRVVVVGRLSTSQQQALVDSGIEYENLVGLSEQEIVAQYRACDIVSFASTYEGFGMPILEGQAVGRPVVTSNRSSMPEVAGSGACLVDPFDVQSIRNGFNRIIEDQGYRTSIVRAGFENVKRFNSEQIARRYLGVYRAVFTSSGPE